MYELNNIVRIGSKDKLEFYTHSITTRMEPYFYNKPENKCIIIQVRSSLLTFVDVMIRKLKGIGLKEISREKKLLRNEKKGYDIPDGWEIKLEKVSAGEWLELKEDKNE